ncbi:osmolarity sensor protein EnvZ [Oceanivirga salmonicida]|uniref:osmolarity sensor protein EnvZ n=1 Tax=Oceanivirga salmonicida TaxID=1769291 RepID=UPI0012E22AC3|nr:osmolarity sensor protein EnvZ [Oceanivirga salmonicida]
MSMNIGIYKEKKEKDFRMVILPSGRNKIGLILRKDYGITSFLSKKDSKKIGELTLWALEQCDDEIIEYPVDIKWEKKYFNCSSVTSAYNLISFKFYENKYKLQLEMKDGYGYSPFKDFNGNKCEYIFNEKPSEKELGEKIMEMFEYKENYDK